MNTNTEATFDVMKEHLLEVKDRFGTDAAKAIIKDFGLAERMADITERFNEVIDACRAKLDPPVVEEEHPLDAAAPGIDDMPPEALQDALSGINAIPDDKRTVEAALGAVWSAWAHTRG